METQRLTSAAAETPLAVTAPPADAWDQFVRSHPRAHLLQLAAWADLKSAFGWESDRLALTRNGQIVAGAQMLYRPFPLRAGRMAYVGFGPLTIDPARSGKGR